MPIARRWKLVLNGSKENISKKVMEQKSLIKFAEGHWETKNQCQFAIYFTGRHRQTAIKKMFNGVIELKPILTEDNFLEYLNTLHFDKADSSPFILGKFITEQLQHQEKKRKPNMETQNILNIVEKMEKNGVSATIINVYENDPDNLFQIATAERILKMKNTAYLDVELFEDAKTVIWLPWQKRLCDLLTEKPDPRRIFVIYDPVGNCGKSFFAQNYRRLHFNTTVNFSNTGRSVDMLYVAQQYSERRVLFLDLSRSEADQVQYNAIEQLKNGSFVSTKYKSRFVDGRPPHFVIFTNFEPDYKKLSMDRWYIFDLKHEDKTTISWTEKTKENSNSI